MEIKTSGCSVKWARCGKYGLPAQKKTQNMSSEVRRVARGGASFVLFALKQSEWIISLSVCFAKTEVRDTCRRGAGRALLVEEHTRGAKQLQHTLLTGFDSVCIDASKLTSVSYVCVCLYIYIYIFKYVYTQVSQRLQWALPATNPALYAAAIEGGYKPNAYLTDYRDPYGGVDSKYDSMMNIGSHMGLNERTHQMQHSIHPHISLLAALQHSNGGTYTQCGVPLG